MSKYIIQTTTKFKKTYKRMVEKQKNNKDDFEKVLKILADGETLPKQYHNHLLEPKSNRSMGMPYKTRLAFNIQKR